MNSTEYERSLRLFAEGDTTTWVPLFHEACRRHDTEVRNKLAVGALERGVTAAIVPALEQVRAVKRPSLTLHAYNLAWLNRPDLLKFCGRALIRSSISVLRLGGGVTEQNPQIGTLRALRLGYETARLYGDIEAGTAAILARDGGYEYLLRAWGWGTQGDTFRTTALAGAIALNALSDPAAKSEPNLLRLAQRVHYRATRERLPRAELHTRLQAFEGFVFESKMWTLDPSHFTLPKLAAPTDTGPFPLRSLSSFVDFALPLVRRMLPSEFGAGGSPWPAHDIRGGLTRWRALLEGTEDPNARALMVTLLDNQMRYLESNPRRRSIGPRVDTGPSPGEVLYLRTDLSDSEPEK